MKRLVFVLLGLTILSVQCHSDLLYSDNRILSKPWQWEDELTFNLPYLQDKVEKSIRIDVTHKTDFAYQNLYLQVSRIVNLDTLTQELSIELTDGSGKWVGTPNGKNFSVYQSINIGATIPNYLIVRQYSRDQKLNGLHSIEVSIVKNPD